MPVNKKKKFYAVKQGFNTGIFEKWEDCKSQVIGYPGQAIYRGFSTLQEAQDYLDGVSKTSGGKKFYAVKVGRNPGIYETWEEARKQVDNYPYAVYKGYPTKAEAKDFLKGNAESQRIEAAIEKKKRTTNGDGENNSQESHFIKKRKSRKNFYAVKKGKKTGIYDSWEICKKLVIGYNGAIFKGFETRKEAEDYLYDRQPSNITQDNTNTSTNTTTSKHSNTNSNTTSSISNENKEPVITFKSRRSSNPLDIMKEIMGIDDILPSKPIGSTRNEGMNDNDISSTINSSNCNVDDSVIIDPTMNQDNPDKAIAYVDGSYNIKTMEYSYGAIIFYKSEGHKFSKKFNDPKLRQMRNVAGEIEGSMKAIQYCVDNNIPEVDIYYDYLGIENWAMGLWKTNKPGTQNYKEFFDRMKSKVKVNFIKVKAHSNDKYNDIADQLAKKAIF